MPSRPVRRPGRVGGRPRARHADLRPRRRCPRRDSDRRRDARRPGCPRRPCGTRHRRANVSGSRSAPGSPGTRSTSDARSNGFAVLLSSSSSGAEPASTISAPACRRCRRRRRSPADTRSSAPAATRCERQRRSRLVIGSMRKLASGGLGARVEEVAHPQRGATLRRLPTSASTRSWRGSSAATCPSTTPSRSSGAARTSTGHACRGSRRPS